MAGRRFVYHDVASLSKSISSETVRLAAIFYPSCILYVQQYAEGFVAPYLVGSFG